MHTAWSGALEAVIVEALGRRLCLIVEHGDLVRKSLFIPLEAVFIRPASVSSAFTTYLHLTLFIVT